jgi:hypothetical protein
MGPIDFQDQFGDLGGSQAGQFESQTTGQTQASGHLVYLWSDRAESYRLNGVGCPVSFLPGIKGRYLEVVVGAEVGYGQAALRLIGKEVPDGFGGMAHGRGFVWGKAQALLWNGQDGVARMLTVI